MERSKFARIAAVGVVSVMLVFSGFFAGRAVADQDHMHSALTFLNDALNQLNVASTGKAGHRINAITLVKQAIGEVNAGIAAGNR